MLYDSNGTPRTGHDLERAFKHPTRSKTLDMDKHFREWKLLFHDNQSDPSIKRIQDGLIRKLDELGKSRLDLLRDVRNTSLYLHPERDISLVGRTRHAPSSLPALPHLAKHSTNLLQWVKLIYQILLTVQDDGLYRLKESNACFDKNDIEIVVTVPPGRSVRYSLRCSNNF